MRSVFTLLLTLVAAVYCIANEPQMRTLQFDDGELSLTYAADGRQGPIHQELVWTPSSGPREILHTFLSRGAFYVLSVARRTGDHFGVLLVSSMGGAEHWRFTKQSGVWSTDGVGRLRYFSFYAPDVREMPTPNELVMRFPDGTYDHYEVTRTPIAGTEYRTVLRNGHPFLEEGDAIQIRTVGGMGGPPPVKDRSVRPTLVPPSGTAPAPPAKPGEPRLAVSSDGVRSNIKWIVALVVAALALTIATWLWRKLRSPT